MTHPTLIEVPSVFGEPVRNLEPSNVLTRPKKYIEVRQYPLNFTNQDLTIAYRNGLKFNLPRQYSRDHQALVIRTEICIDNLVEINADHLLSVVQEHCSSELKLFQAAISPQDQPYPYREPYGGVNLIIDYSISIQELRKHGGSVYFHDVDIMVSHLPVELAPEHPHSEQGRLKTICLETHQREGSRFGFAIEIVDNQGTIGDRYINIGGRVSKIPATEDPRKMDGIYVSWNQSVSGKLSLPETALQHLSADDADLEFNLFKSYGEAEQFGNGDESRKRQLVELEHEATIAKTQLALEKAETDRENIRLEQSLKTLTFQHDTLKSEREDLMNRQNLLHEAEKQRLKDHYEARSYRRKDDSEVLRVLPVIAMGIGAVIMAIKAFF
ncbi:MAG: hypothetical protein P4L77_11500 [Sulfuriferula sp.]|nr:hypothetical protein [Sulfuriferula sp.]